MKRPLPSTRTSWATCILLAWALLAFVGCGARSVHIPRSDPEPAMTLTVFDDGFHSGFILPYDGMPIVLDRERAQAQPPLPPFVEIGFGEARWLQGLDRSFLHAVRLGVWPADGMIMMVNLPERIRTDAEAAHTRYWELQLTVAGKRAVYAEFDRWIDRRRVYVRPANDPQFFYESTHRYTVFRNCHDFTLAILRAACFPLGSRWVTSSGSFDRQMSRGVELLQAAGIHAIGP